MKYAEFIQKVRYGFAFNYDNHIRKVHIACNTDETKWALHGTNIPIISGATFDISHCLVDRLGDLEVQAIFIKDEQTIGVVL